MIIVLIAGLVLAFLLYRAFPMTVMAILGANVFLAWEIFAKDLDPSETTSQTIAIIIVIAFCLDVVSRVLRLFRR